MPLDTAGMSDVSPQRHRIFKSWRDREDADHIPILQRPFQTISIQRIFLDPPGVVGLDALDYCFLSIRGRRQPSRHLDCASEARPLPQFVNRRHVYAARDSNEGSGGRDIDDIAGQ